MDRKAIVAIALSLVTLFAWTYYSQKQTEKMNAWRKTQRDAAEAAKAAAEPAAAAPEAVPVAPVEPSAPAAPVAMAQTEKVTTPSVAYTLTNLGGGVARVELLKHAAEKNTRMVLNEFATVPIGAVTLQPDENLQAPFTQSVDPNAGVATYERTIGDHLLLTKRFQLPRAGDREEYAFKIDVTFANRGTAPAAVPGYYMHLGGAAPIHQTDQAIYTGFTYHGASKFIDATWFGGGGFLGIGGGARPVYPDKQKTLMGVRWAGVTNQYFSTIVSPLVTATDSAGQSQQRGNGVWARRFTVTDAAWEAAGHTKNGTAERLGVEGALGMPGFTLAPGETRAQSFQIYAGPREYSRIKRLGSDEEQVMDFGMFGFVSKTLLNSMNWLNARLGSYAAAIIVLTIIIKLLLWPLQNKATNSMKRMALLSPKMTELREKHADNPQKMNEEIMKLYKDYGVNPVGGCLPMLVQIPIFFGFYNMLGKAVELRNSKFLWVQDLSQPDTIAHLPLLGWPLNVLPLLMAATMFWTMAISPKSGDATQQKIFMFMPLIFVFFCYNFASALALYWTVQNIFSVAQLYATRNQAPPTLEKVAAPATKKRK
jgi:YidC/Oxa1 family membrane protein insertase